MSKNNWEICYTEKGGKNTDLIYCKSKKHAIKQALELEKSNNYEMVIIQCNDGNEIIEEFTISQLGEFKMALKDLNAEDIYMYAMSFTTTNGSHTYNVHSVHDDYTYFVEKTLNNEELRFNPYDCRVEFKNESTGKWDIYLSDEEILQTDIIDRTDKKASRISNRNQDNYR